jgi:hypothetical protein
VVINTEGLFSYRKPQENYSVHIASADMEELWTNFERVGEKLVVKVKHRGEITQFAIPVLDYCLRDEERNWLFAFYRLLMEHRIHIKA